MEADNTRIFPHVQESLLRKVSVNIVCIKSPDTDVFILGIRFQKEFWDEGCKELWLITVTFSKKRALGCHFTLRKALKHNCLKFCSHYTHWQGVTLLVSYLCTYKNQPIQYVKKCSSYLDKLTKTSKKH